MWCVVEGRSHLLGWFCAIVTLLCLSFPALGESALVIPDEYIIEPTNTIQAFSSNASEKLYRVDRFLGNRQLKVGKRAISLMKKAYTQGPALFDPSDDFCSRLVKSGAAIKCSPNFVYQVSTIPNDALYSQLWGLHGNSGIDAPAAWDISTGSPDTVVAVIDTGIDYTHPDLAQNVWTNPLEIAGNGIDDDGDGYTDDIHGINAATGSGDPMDDNSHGTHVSGTIGGSANNALGVAGINWNVKIMGLKFISSNGSGSLSDAIEAINYMVAMKHRGVNIRVCNNSWGGGGYSQILHDAIQRANDAGILFVAAAGNESNDNDRKAAYPASYQLPNVVSVAAIDSEGNLASFSNYGQTTVHIAAPGVGIVSTVPGGGYKSYSGTSMATPHVTGALALLISAFPDLSNDEILTRLYGSGVDSSALTGLMKTGRRLNVARLLRGDVAPIPDNAGTDPCKYDVSSAAFHPNRNVESAKVVLRADELNYAQVRLPFLFPFFGQSISHITISPNGVVYMNGEPNTMDFQNAFEAPANAIAALHTDLDTDSKSFGVRVLSSDEEVTIFWYGRHASLPKQGWVKVWLTLHRDGSVEDFVSISDAAVQSAVQAGATIGVKAKAPGTVTTYAYDNAEIRNGLGLQFHTQCRGSDVAISSMQALGMYRGKASAKYASPRKLVNVIVNGSGAGTASLEVGFDRKFCSGTLPITLSGETESVIGGILPSLPSGVRSVRFRVAQKSKALSISNDRSTASSRRSRNLGAHALRDRCESFFTSLAQLK